MNDHNYKVCILAAGKGTRNTVINGLHKALLPIENKAAISHIIEQVPVGIEIVIAIGYKFEQIKAYLTHTHSERKIVFVDIKNYDGKGSGPGLSLLTCKDHLQTPFVFLSADTIVEEDFCVGDFDHNWMGVSSVDQEISGKYCLVKGDEFLNGFYYGEGKTAFVGLAGIYDYEKFWNSLSNGVLIKNEHQVLNGFNDLEKVRLRYFTWHDTGNNEAYLETRERFNKEIVAPKNDECIFIDNGNVIKYSSDTDKISSIIDRVQFLNHTCPNVKRIHDNMFEYKYVEESSVIHYFR